MQPKPINEEIFTKLIQNVRNMKKYEGKKPKKLGNISINLVDKNPKSYCVYNISLEINFNQT